ADQCARCCAGAPATSAQMPDEYSKTVRTEVNRTLPAPLARGVLRGIGLTGDSMRRVRRDADAAAPPAERAAPPPLYQRRGDVTDETRERLERLPNVEWAGYYDPADLQRVLEPYHVGVIPSVWEEVYGYVGLELLAAGLPVIGNARGGIVDYVRDGETGWVN